MIQISQILERPTLRDIIGGIFAGHHDTKRLKWNLTLGDEVVDSLNESIRSPAVAKRPGIKYSKLMRLRRREERVKSAFCWKRFER